MNLSYSFQYFVQNSCILAYFWSRYEHICYTLCNKFKGIEEFLVRKYFFRVVPKINIVFSCLFFNFFIEIIYIIICFLFNFGCDQGIGNGSPRPKIIIKEFFKLLHIDAIFIPDIDQTIGNSGFVLLVARLQYFHILDKILERNLCLLIRILPCRPYLCRMS